MKIWIFSISIVCTLSAAAEFSVSQNTKCKVFLKSSQSGLKTNWHGPCKDGFAHGLGVVRYLKGSKVDSIFYGILTEGYWASGVHDAKAGYLAGQFSKNERVEVKDAEGVDDRNVTLRAFETAAKAATQISQEFQKQGNKASARHYKAEAEKLAGQMD